MKGESEQGLKGKGGEIRERGWEERAPKAHFKNSDFGTPMIWVLSSGLPASSCEGDSSYSTFCFVVLGAIGVTGRSIARAPKIIGVLFFQIPRVCDICRRTGPKLVRKFCSAIVGYLGP